MIPNRSSLLLALCALTAAATAQTTTTPHASPSTTTPVHRPATTTATAHPATAAAACSKIPDLSPKIPALPAGLACPKPLFTITVRPQAELTYISPLEDPGLAKGLGLESSSFSLSYVDVKVGTGPLALPHKWYTINYTGYLVDGTKFDSSYDRNEPFYLQYGARKVVIGWDTGFDGMRIGGKRRLFIPYQLAYGPNGRPPAIPGQAELIFDVELIAQSDTDPTPAPKPAPTPAATPSPAPAGAPTPGAATPPPPATTPAPAPKPAEPAPTPNPQGL